MPTLPDDLTVSDSAVNSSSTVPVQSSNPAPAALRKSSGVVLWLRDLIVAAAASVLIITFLYQPVRVEGTSMLPRLEDQRSPLHQQVCLSFHGR